MPVTPSTRGTLHYRVPHPLREKRELHLRPRKLEDDVNDLCGEAIADARPQRLLKYLKQLNKDQ